ncbi:hypothetical protein ASPFODRAFT_337371 [Aspergillus luchuensis CBS 106.47]|uniref:Uncharacterized protein n=1 Tax=Aspergillus luchuensis (strain CBS 106.47) TaxID=1137211 RepID=A0A1M3T7X9_ASPLC|nr:hypothetical protein ASPFODRAFT_337371 [Aspergillus luchuensis CBS 106.47]
MSKEKVTCSSKTVNLRQVRQDVEDQVGHETWAIKSCAAEYSTRYLSTLLGFYYQELHRCIS